MANDSIDVVLPLSTEKTLRRIYDEQFIEPLNSKSRQQLALLGEEEALKVLQMFRSLPNYITFMLRVSDSASVCGAPPVSCSESQSQLDDVRSNSLNLEVKGKDRSLRSSSTPRHINLSNYNHDSYMDLSPTEVPLPLSIEKALRRIQEEQNLLELNSKSRSELALLGEEAALIVLQRYRSLPNYIDFMVGMSDCMSSQGSNSCSGGHISRAHVVQSDCILSQGSNSCSGGQISRAHVFQSQQDDGVLNSLSIEEHKRYKDFASSSSLRKLNSSCLEKSNIPDCPLLQSLGELEFRKAFLILSYCGRAKLEDVITVDVIRKMRNMQMKEFESVAWRAIGCKCIEEIERSKNVEWDSGRTYLYQCHVDTDASYTFKGPYLRRERTHLQKVLGDDNVVEVKFADQEKRNSFSSIYNTVISGYHKIAKEGILVGLRRYHFFVFKDGGKVKKKDRTSSQVKCYFICTTADNFVDLRRPHTSLTISVHQARSMFMHVHMVTSVAKYMPRFSLILSKTVKLDMDLGMVNVVTIADIPCCGPDGHTIYNEDGEALIHTDGTGFISENLAAKCPQNIYKAKYAIPGEFERVLDRVEHDGELSVPAHSQFHNEEPPLLIQSRLFNNGIAVKGTFLINKTLPENTIQIRPSMIKVKRDTKLIGAKSANSFEIVSTSYKARKPACLSRYLIALLNYGGVPAELFTDFVENSLEEARSAHSNKRAALKVSLRYGEMDDFTVPRMILCGIPLDEPHLKSRLSVAMTEDRKSIKEGKFPINECYYLMGTADPTGKLKSDEVCVILDHGQVSGEVLVYRHPGLHFGDIHILNATCIKELEEFVGNSKYAIFFPTQGSRSLADEIAGGDFDGDMYWVSRNPKLLEWYNASEPWIQKYSTKSAPQRTPLEFSPRELEDVLFQQFLTNRFHPSYNIGYAADSWLSFMDRLLTLNDDCAEEKETLRENMLQLVDLYYDALDAPKTGKKVEIPEKLKAEKFPHYMERQNSFRSKSVLGLIYDKVDSFKNDDLSKDVWKLPCFDVEDPPSCLNIWEDHYEKYKAEMTSAMKIVDQDAKNAACDDLIRKYKQILYDAEEFEVSPKKKEDIFNDALAIYHLVYDYAKKISDVGRCNFAWKVAGRALCTLYALKNDKDIIVCQKSVLRELFN